MLQGRREGQNMLLRRVEVARRQEQASQGDEHISAPRPGPAGSEVRQACSQARLDLPRIKRCGRDAAEHLDRAERQILRERGAGSDKVDALLHGGPSGGLVGLVDDNREVLRSEEGGHGRLDLVEALLEPSGRLGNAGERLCLPGESQISIEGYKKLYNPQTDLSSRECT